MLHDFLTLHRDDIIERARIRVASRQPLPIAQDLGTRDPTGVSLLVDQLSASLAHRTSNNRAISETAAEHGRALCRRGFTLPQVVHGYGDICQVVTELAIEADAAITNAEFQTFNLCLDDAIASAVVEYGRLREESIVEAGTERLGFLAHEIRNLLGNALLSFDLLKLDSTPVASSTGAILARSLSRLHEFVDRSLAEVRVESGLRHDDVVIVNSLLDEMAIGAGIAATARGIHLELVRAAPEAIVLADKQLLGSAIDNLVQNAIKFTRNDGRVLVTARTNDNRVCIDVADECGGLSPGSAEKLFAPFEQRSTDRTGLGLGLAISRKGMRRMGGDIVVRDLVPGSLGEKGCVFTLDLALVS